MALLLLAVAAATPSAPPKNLFWCSWAGPNQTLTLGGALPFTHAPPHPHLPTIRL